eukprot:GHRQ01032721.1.p2 GENE.GHRQ01032721.1~~GHRQ01032721.1.p2  ORF type:complete len:100 (+),score=2.73 GHRQ01032721.1:377-676(+)
MPAGRKAAGMNREGRSIRRWKSESSRVVRSASPSRHMREMSGDRGPEPSETASVPVFRPIALVHVPPAATPAAGFRFVSPQQTSAWDSKRISGRGTTSH